MTKCVLIVDDERTVLRSLEKLLKEEDYHCTYMTSGEEALDFLEKHPVNMIVSDTRMPEMDGEVLLAEVKKRFPNVIRVALCHISESKRISKLIEKGLAKQYLFKPWNDNDMRMNIKNILEMELRLLDLDNLGRINKLDDLPSLPSLYHQLTALIEKDADMIEVAELISRDQAITLKILKLANSAFYGRKTGSINQAIMTMGLNNVRNIVLTNSFFKDSSESMDRLWQHTVDTNRLCLAIYDQCLNKRMPSLFGSAGLLHDVGRVIIYMFYDEEYCELIKESVSTDATLVNLELDHFHSTHQEVGAYLLNNWGLPYAYVEAAMFHHRPLDERIVNQELIAVVHLADYYASKILSPDGTHNLLDQGVFERLDITREEVEKLAKTLK
jgi:HD-like signal output (HDOD) protein